VEQFRNLPGSAWEGKGNENLLPFWELKGDIASKRRKEGGRAKAFCPVCWFPPKKKKRKGERVCIKRRVKKSSRGLNRKREKRKDPASRFERLQK